MQRKSLDAVETTTHDHEKAHITLKAVTTVTDEGLFEAVISTQSIDREKDIVDADGMVKALRKWPRQIPLTWEHSTRPEDIFGHLDPQSVKNVNGEVVASGQVDMDSNNGAAAWQSFKARRVGFSFAYLTLGATKRKGGGFHITELDIFEITATRAPMNNDTRVLSTKGATELREDSDRIERELNDAALPELPPAPVDEEPDPEPVQEPPPPAAKDAETLRRESVELDRKLAEERIPDVPAPEPVEIEPEPLAAKDIIELAAALSDEDKRAVKDAVTVQEPKDPETLRKDSQRLEREIAESHLPAATELPEAPAEPEIDLAKELQEVKDRLVKAETEVDNLRKKAEVTDQEPSARSVDPLRKRSEELALEITSGGMSLRRPPTKAADPEPELVPLGELRRQSRDLMSDLLSGDLE